MIYVSPKPLPCNQTQLLTSLQNATSVFEQRTTSNDTSSEDVCYNLYARICEPFFSVTCQPPTGGHGGHGSQLDLPRPPALETWGIGLFSIFIVCSCAVYGLCLYPIMKKKFFHYILTWMIGLAIGSLSGIAVFHLIPQAFELEDETPEQVERYIHKSLVMIASIYAFFLSERIFKLAMQHKKSRQIAKSTTNLAICKSSEKAPVMTSPETPPDSETSESRYTVETGLDEDTTFMPEEQIESGMAEEHAHFHGHDGNGGQPLQTVAWLILSGDSIVDGMSIGAAFSVSTLRGISIAVAVLCEELPHELGDLAILLHSGLTLRRAITYNCLSGLTCFAGFAVGVLIGELTAASTWIFAFAGGMFIYISFVNILPEMTAAIEDAGSVSTKKGVMVMAIQTFGLLAGIALMYVLARFSGEINIG